MRSELKQVIGEHVEAVEQIRYDEDEHGGFRIRGFWQAITNLLLAMHDQPTVHREDADAYRTAIRLGKKMMVYEDSDCLNDPPLSADGFWDAWQMFLEEFHDAKPPEPTLKDLPPLETVAQLDRLDTPVSDRQICKILGLTEQQLEAERVEPGSVMNNPESEWTDPRTEVIEQRQDKPFYWPPLNELSAVAKRLPRPGASKPEPERPTFVGSPVIDTASPKRDRLDARRDAYAAEMTGK